MRIGIVGGTGKLGSSLAGRWATAGHSVVIGSRDASKAAERAAKLSEGAATVQGMDYAGAAAFGEIVVLTVPYEAHEQALRAIGPAVSGKPLVDTTVPLKPPKVSRVQLPQGQAAALEAQVLVGGATPVVAALHHVSAEHLAHRGTPLACDVLVASDDAKAKSVAMGLIGDLGLRALDAGPLVNAIALESLTPVLIHLNRVYGSRGAGIVLTDLPNAPSRAAP
jgi:8-hydroxy-5-deazaflavin:NADPH oxidoreductase